MDHPTIRIIIADDHAFVRKSLRRLLKLQPRLKLVAEAENGSEAVALVEKHRPDLVVMDISMPVMNELRQPVSSPPASPPPRLSFSRHTQTNAI